MRRIVSLVPSATDILYALGVGDQVVGVSHECDLPAESAPLPRLTKTIVDCGRASSRDIDTVVQDAIRQQRSLYTVDETLLAQLRPDLVITQQLCEVCAITADDITTAVWHLPNAPRLLALHPHTLEAAFEDIHRVGEAIGCLDAARELIESLRARIERVRISVEGARRPRVFCLEWLDPPMATGHWVPEMIKIAGGEEVLGRAGARSRYVTSDDIIAARPEVLILMPCGFSVARTRQELSLAIQQPWWPKLPATQQGHVWLVNGPAYFNCSGPRLIDGTELLAAILHPDRVPHPTAPDAVERLTTRS